MPTKLTKPIFLCGYTNSGKTTIGKELARQLDVPFYDTDELITPRQDRLHNRSSPLKATKPSAILNMRSPNRYPAIPPA